MQPERRLAWWCLIVAVMLVGFPSRSAAQDFQITPLPPDQQDPAVPAQYGWAQPPKRRVPAFEGTAYFEVPLWNDVPRDIVRPGFALAFRGAIDLGYIAPEFEGGFRWVWVDLDQAREENPGDIPDTARGTETLRSFYFGAGLRLQIPNDSIVTPYASTIFTLNWWNFLETSYGCGWWYCSTFDVFRFTPGFNWRFGLAIAPRPQFAIEAGLGVGLSFKGDFFDDNQSWLSPYVGFTFRK